MTWSLLLVAVLSTLFLQPKWHRPFIDRFVHEIEKGSVSLF